MRKKATSGDFFINRSRILAYTPYFFVQYFSPCENVFDSLKKISTFFSFHSLKEEKKVGVSSHHLIVYFLSDHNCHQGVVP